MIFTTEMKLSKNNLHTESVCTQLQYNTVKKQQQQSQNVVIYKHDCISTY